MEYGFVIDQRRCIGCHACTVACKAENEVPLGTFRTWVKYVEKGTFPEVRRHFTVLRCNHCDEAPCVEICPVSALEKRADAIVDLDRDVCIGCRACMQACPYDALYLNEDRGVVEKCHYCAHRTELDLEPACVVVCPERAIVAGDVSNPKSGIATVIREEQTSRRKVEKGTEPRVWYVDALAEALEPGASREPAAWLWSDRADEPPPVVPGYEPTPDIVTTLNVAHPPAWGWHVWTYMLTKNVAAGAAMIAPFLAAAGIAAGFGRDLLPEITGLVFLAITSWLLVDDLGRKERFLSLLTRGNPRSWLVKGTWILTAFGGLLSVGLVLRLAGLDAAADLARWVNLPVSVLASGYTAWLFKQCRGRDLWIEPGLFSALVVRAAAMGAALGMLVAGGGEAAQTFRILFLLMLLLNLLLMFWERVRRPTHAAAGRAHGILKNDSAALLAPVMLMVAGAFRAFSVELLGTEPSTLVELVAAALAAGGILLYERAWIRAGQAVPNS